MISMIKAGVFGVILGAGMTLFVTRVHVLNTEDGLIVVPRSHPAEVRSVYVDVRKWNASMWQEYPDVTEAVVESGRSDLLVETGLNDLFSSNEAATEVLPNSDASEIVKSLVPIRFEDASEPKQEGSLPIRFFGEEEATSEAKEGSVSQAASDADKLVAETAPPKTGAEKPTDLLAAIGIQPAANEVFPQGVDLSRIGLPELQHPVPIESDPFLPVSTSTERTKPQIEIRKEETKTDPEWVSNFIQSLIPGSDSNGTQINHSAAKMNFPIDLQAPEPGDILPPNSWLTDPASSQAPIQAVRPF